MIKDWLLTEENHLNILGHLVIAGVLKVFTRAIPPPPPHGLSNLLENKHEEQTRSKGCDSPTTATAHARVHNINNVTLSFSPLHTGFKSF